MNEFPGNYMQAMRDASGGQTPALNTTEYLEYLESIGLTIDDYPAIQPIMQQRIWEKFKPA